MKENQPFSSGVEQYSEHEPPLHSRIALSVFRHGKKGANVDGDANVRLTPEGRKGAMETGEMFRDPDASVEQSIAIGSPRVRARETAAFVMTGAEETITGEETFEELKSKIDQGRAVGSKIGSDVRLDFNEGTPEYLKEMVGAMKAGRLMDWMVHESDAVVEKLGDEKGSSYSREARGVAELIRRYLRAAPRFDQLVSDPAKKYEPVMQRFLGTHQSVCESFLAKVIEKTRGLEERKKFIDANVNGFDFVEGVRVNIDSAAGNKEPKIFVEYEKKGIDGKRVYHFAEQIRPEVLEEIVEDGKKLEERMSK